MISLAKILREGFGDENYETIKVEDFTVHVLKQYTHPTFKTKISTPKVTDKKIQKIFQVLRYIEEGLDKAKLPPSWKRLEIYIEPIGAKESKFKQQGTPEELSYGRAFYSPIEDAIVINSTYIKSNLFDWKKLARTLAHEISHRAFMKFILQGSKLEKRLDKIIDSYRQDTTPEGIKKARRHLGFDQDYGIESAGKVPEEFFAELVSHITIYSTDPKYKLWQKILNYILKGKR